ncbi:hypothetical protein D9M68_866940 [compost metagenome]
MHPSNHITQRQDRWFASFKVVIDVYVTLLIEFDAGIFQAQIVEHRPPASGVENAVRLQLTTVVECRQ